jgi:L-ascorbate metabolism protein UlaG (beta-lactamase superfamily)
MYRLIIVIVFSITLTLSGCSLILDRQFSQIELMKFCQYPTVTRESDIENQVTVTYFGTSTLLISDGTNKLLIDGFFSRPTISELLWGFEPNKKVNDEIIRRHNLGDLSVIIPVHSHHDHAMDAPYIAKFTSATLLGTSSTLNIQGDSEIAADKWEKAELYVPYTYGDFKVTLLPTEHGKVPSFLKSILGMGEEITSPLEYPSKLWDYSESSAYSVLVEHQNTNLLVHASTGFKDDALKYVEADWIFLGIAGLGKMSTDRQKSYIDNTVTAIGASKVIPIHWDDIMRFSEDKLYPPKRFTGNFGDDLEVLERINAEQNSAFSLHLLRKEEVIHLNNDNKPIENPQHSIKMDKCLRENHKYTGLLVENG